MSGKERLLPEMQVNEVSQSLEKVALFFFLKKKKKKKKMCFSSRTNFLTVVLKRELWMAKRYEQFLFFPTREKK